MARNRRRGSFVFGLRVDEATAKAWREACRRRGLVQGKAMERMMRQALIEWGEKVPSDDPKGC